VKKVKSKPNCPKSQGFQDGCVGQIAIIIKDHPKDSTYKFHFDRAILGEQFDLHLCKDMLEELCASDMVTAPIIQLNHM